MNGDGFPDVAISSLRENGGAEDAGRVYVFSIMQLADSMVGGELTLNWSTWPSATEYWVYGADNNPYFVPGVTPPYQYRIAVIPAGTTTWSTTEGICDPDHDWSFIVAGAGTGFTDTPHTSRVGECEYGITIGP
jgi:hypothetical protein